MKKELGSLSSIVLLFLLLVGWWSVTMYGPLVFTPALSDTNPPITVYHHSTQDADTYSGSVLLPECVDLQVAVASSQTVPVETLLTLTTQPSAQPCSKKNTLVSVPFLVAVSNNGQPSVLKQVQFNAEAAVFSILEQ